MGEKHRTESTVPAVPISETRATASAGHVAPLASPGAKEPPLCASCGLPSMAPLVKNAAGALLCSACEKLERAAALHGGVLPRPAEALWVTCDALREPHLYSSSCCGVVRSVPAPEACSCNASWLDLDQRDCPVHGPRAAPALPAETRARWNATPGCGCDKCTSVRALEPLEPTSEPQANPTPWTSPFVVELVLAARRMLEFSAMDPSVDMVARRLHQALVPFAAWNPRK
jgi:hypothetical protein